MERIERPKPPDSPQLRWRFRRRLDWSFAVIFLLIIASAPILYYAGNLVIKSNDRQRDLLTDIVKLQQFMSTMEKAEAAQRGFLITISDSQLTTFNQAKLQIPTLLAEFCGRWPRDRKVIDDLAHRRIALLERAIALRKSEGVEAANAVVISGEGQHLMDDLRARTVRLQKLHETAIRNEMNYQDRLTGLRTVTFLVCCAFSALFTAWCYVRITDLVEEEDLRLLEKYS